MGGVCCVLSCTFAALGRSICRGVRGRSFSGVRGLFTTVLTGKVNLRLGRKLCQRCVGYIRSLAIIQKGVSVPKAVQGELRTQLTIAYSCSRLSRGGLLGRVLGSAILLVLERGSMSRGCGTRLGGRVLCFSRISRVRLSRVH